MEWIRDVGWGSFVIEIHGGQETGTGIGLGDVTDRVFVWSTASQRISKIARWVCIGYADTVR